LNIARGLRFQASLPITFWGECVLTAAHLINRTPTKPLHLKTPCEVLFGTKPTYETLKVLECLCYAHNREPNRDKFGSRATKYLFLGYPHGQKGWRVYDLKTRKVLTSRDVIFYEDVFPFQNDQGTSLNLGQDTTDPLIQPIGPEPSVAHDPLPQQGPDAPSATRPERSDDPPVVTDRPATRPFDSSQEALPESEHSILESTRSQ